MKRGKKYLAALEKIEPQRKYTLDEAVAKLKEIAFAKFDETVELTMWLGVDPRKADQLVRGTIVLPHGLGGAAKKVVVIAQGDKIREAQEAGADEAGGDEPSEIPVQHPRPEAHLPAGSLQHVVHHAEAVQIAVGQCQQDLEPVRRQRVVGRVRHGGRVYPKVYTWGVRQAGWRNGCVGVGRTVSLLDF